MFHKIISVRAASDMRLLLWFQGGEIKQYNVRPLLSKWKPFEFSLHLEKPSVL
jgi:hypothetical protein